MTSHLHHGAVYVTLVAAFAALGRRVVRGQISVDDFNTLHSAMVLRLNAERERMASERQRLALEEKRLQAQEEATEAAARAQRETAEALMHQQEERQSRAENQERQKRDPMRCNGIVSGKNVRLKCK